MRVLIGLLPVPMRLFDLPIITKPHVLMADSIIPAPKRRTGIAAARREAKKRRRAKR